MQSKLPVIRLDDSSEDAVLTTDVIASMSTALAALCPDDIVAVATQIECGLRERRKILLLGNGGSCATASHLATDLRLMASEAGLPASIEPLNDNACLLTAMANDYGFARSGAALIEATASEGDILVIFSCSARSPNLLHAAQTAARLGVVTLLIGSILAPADFPARSTILVQSKRYAVIETTHLAITHLISGLVRQRFGVQTTRCAIHFPQDSQRAGD